MSAYPNKVRLELTASEIQLVNGAIALLQATQDEDDCEFTPDEISHLRHKVWAAMDRMQLP